MNLLDVVLQRHDLVRPLALALGARLGEGGATNVVSRVRRVRWGAAGGGAEEVGGAGVRGVPRVVRSLREDAGVAKHV